MPSRPPYVAFVILAAGLGSRLSSAFSGKPKWMVPISADLTVSAQQLSSLEAALAPDAPRVVVTGAHADAVEAFAAERATAGSAPFQTVHNNRFAEWNNWYSLLLGLDHLEQIGWDGPTLVVNGDLFCPAHWYAMFAATHSEWTDVAMAIDATRVPSEEAMKVAVVDGSVKAIGKVGVDNPYGEYIGLAGLTATGRKQVCEALRSLEISGRTNDWYEGAFQIAIDEGAHVRAWEIPDGDWVEIDDDRDLEAARLIAASTFEASDT